MELNNTIQSGQIQGGVSTTSPSTQGSGVGEAYSSGQGVAQSKNPTPVENQKDITEEMSKEEQAKQLKESVEEMNSKLSPLNFGVKFGFSDDIDSMYVSVYERETDKVIRKIPSEEAMQLMAKMKEVIGLIFDKKG